MLHTASNRHNHSYGAFSHPNGLVHVRDCDLLLGALVLVENLERIGRKFTRSIMPHKLFLFVELRLNLSYACRDEVLAVRLESQTKALHTIAGFITINSKYLLPP